MEDDYRLFEGTALYDRLKSTGELYDLLMKKEEVFCDAFDIHCTPGCGTCCEHFVPDVTQSEAEYLAWGLIRDGREEEILARLDGWKEESPYCPLYNFDQPDGHCSVYPYRPLICRLFGACASEDKDGRPVYRNCRWNTRPVGADAETMGNRPTDVIVMRDFGIRLEEINFEDTGTTLLPDALVRAVDKILWLRAMKEEENAEGK